MAEIDPTIALSYRPPNLAAMPNLQVQTPLEGLARVVSLRNLMQEGQLKGLQLDQLRQQIAEQKLWSQMLGNSLTPPAGTGPPPAPADLGQTPAVPSVPSAPFAGGAPVTPLGVDVTAGLDKYLTAPGPAPVAPAVAPAPQPTTVSASQLMGPQPTPQQGASPMPQPISQQTEPGAPPWWPAGVPSPTRIMQRLPVTGAAIVKQIEDQQKDVMDLAIKQQTIAKGKTEEQVRLANGSIDNESFQRNLIAAGNAGYLPWEEVRRRGVAGFDDPANQAWLKSTQMSAVTADKQQEMNIALLNEARNAATFGAEFPKKIADAKVADFQEASDAAPDLRTESPAVWLSKRGPYAAQRFASILNSDIPLEQKITAIQMGAGGAADVAKSAATTTATKEAEHAVELKQDEPTIQGVVNGTIPWENVEPATKARIQSEVQRRLAQPQPGAAAPQGAGPQGAPAAVGAGPGAPGTSIFAKPISDAQRTQLGNYDRAYTILDQTEADLKNPDKTSTMGPIVGDIANLRWAVKTREFRDLLVARALQLKNYLTSTQRINPQTMELIDRIFPTIKTQPEEALAKIQQLKAMIAGERASAVRDMGGLAIPEELQGPPSAGGGPAPAPTPTPTPTQTQPTPPPSAKPSPVGPAATKAPADVQDFLKDRPWGRYKLNDGRVFYKTKDGQIVPFQ